MAGLLWWQAIHSLCILGHLGMLVSGFAAFVFNDSGFPSPKSVVMIPWTASVLGALGAMANTALFTSLQQAQLPLDRSLISQAALLVFHPLQPSTLGLNQPYPSTETSETAYFRTKVTILVGAILNLFFFSVDWSLAYSGVAIDSKYSSPLLTVVCILAMFAGTAALASIAADVVKVLRERAHQKIIEQRDLDDIDGEYRDEEEG